MLLLAIVLGFALCAVSQVMTDLRSGIDAPMWALRPTFGKALMAGSLWFLRPIGDGASPGVPMGRAIAFGTLAAVTKWAAASAVVFLAVWASGLIFDNMVLRAIVALPLFAIGALVLLPLAGLLLMPVTLLLSFPLDWLFPLRERK